MKMRTILIIGGGMAGLCAAIEAVRSNADVSVSILDAGDQPGRKIYATGNGRCNLTNMADSPLDYRTGDGFAQMRYYEPGWALEVISFMESLGVLTHERNGYVYPRTDQASTVAEALVREALRNGVQIRCGVKATACARTEDGTQFVVTAMDGGNEISLMADRVILASGGMVSPMYNCRGDGYRIARQFGHTIVPPVPALCSLTSDEPFLKMASGIRTSAMVSLYRKQTSRPGEPGTGTLLPESGQDQGAEGTAGQAPVPDQLLSVDAGEVQMTDTGISGIPVFQVSRYMEGGFRPGRTPGGEIPPSERPGEETGESPYYAVLDFLPEMSPKDWERECAERIGRVRPSDTLGDFCLGLVPDKIASWLLAGIGQVREKKIANIGGGDPEVCRQTLRSIMNACRAKRIPITGSAGFEKAQATAGGISLAEVTEHMESFLAPGLFFAGEILDVDGICGGYNLTWALHSGRLAGKYAAEEVRP